MASSNGHMIPSSDANLYPILEVSLSGRTVNYTLKYWIRHGPIYWKNNSNYKVVGSGSISGTQTKTGNIYTSSETGEIIHLCFSGSFLASNAGGTATIQITNNTFGTSYSNINFTGMSVSCSISIPSNYSPCQAPDKESFVVIPSYINPGEKVDISWSGAEKGKNNSIHSYYLQWRYNGDAWSSSNSTTIYTSASSGETSVSMPSNEGKYLDFRIRTQGSAGNGYYSEYVEKNKLVQIRSKPSMKVCSASQSYGTYTITWSTATAGIDNPISAYEIWYSYKTSSSGSWSTRTRIANVSSSTRSYTWSGGTVGYYYRFSVVALGTNYSYSSTELWSAGYKKDYSYTACGAPSNLKSNNNNPTIGQTITLSWTAGTAGTNNSVTGYELYYSTNSGSTYNLISSSIGASTTSYSYTVPRTPGEIRFRIRTKSSAGSSYYSGYNYSSNYQTITIKQANPPTAGTVTITPLPSKNKVEEFSISWANFAGNTYNPISGYSLYYKSSKTNNDSDFSTSMTAISTDIGASTTSYTWSGGNWNYHYKFYVKAKGQYYGESPYAESTAVLKETEDSTPPTEILYRGSGYIKYKGSNYAIPGLKIKAMPIGASNADYYTVEYREVKENGTATSWKVVGNDISLNKYINPVTISKSLINGDYIEFRAKSKNVAGVYSEYFPSDAELYNYRILIRTFSKENLNHPIVQIKRGHKDSFNREDSLSEGIRLKEGELFLEYSDNINPKLKVATKDNSKFQEALLIGGGKLSEIYKETEIDAPTNFKINLGEMYLYYNPSKGAIEFISK